MKRFLYSILMALPLLIMAVACDTDSELPDTSIYINYSGAQDVDDVLYVLQGDTLSIDSVSVAPNPGTKRAALMSVQYSVDGWILANRFIAPFTFAVPTYSYDPGDYTLQLQCPIVQEGKAPATVYVATRFRIVENPEDIPAGDGSTTGRITRQADTKYSD